MHLRYSRWRKIKQSIKEGTLTTEQDLENVIENIKKITFRKDK